jgi:hypothetical protein
MKLLWKVVCFLLGEHRWHLKNFVTDKDGQIGTLFICKRCGAMVFTSGGAWPTKENSTKVVS